MEQRIPTVVITGPVGVGKSSVGSALSSLLGAADVAHALVDMDHLRWCNRAPADDPFNVRLGLNNLACVWTNYAAAGAEHLIIVDIVEGRQEIDGYAAAVPGTHITIVRLRASVSTIHGRLRGRETGANLEWHQRRAIELVEQMDRDQVEDIAIDTEGKTVNDLAAEVLQQLGWM